MVVVSVEPFEIETTTRRGDLVRADVYLPAGRDGPVPVCSAPHPTKRRSATCLLRRPCSPSSSTGRSSSISLSTEMRPFLRYDRAEPLEPARVYEFRIELLPVSVLVRKGERLRLEISNWESAITEAPMTHWYGQKVGTDTYHHDARCPSRLRLHERPRGER